MDYKITDVEMRNQVSVNSYYMTSKQLSVTCIRSITQRTIEQLLQLNTKSTRNFKQQVYGPLCQGAGYYRSLSVSTEVIY